MTEMTVFSAPLLLGLLLLSGYMCRRGDRVSPRLFTTETAFSMDLKGLLSVPALESEPIGHVPGCPEATDETADMSTSADRYF